ncbi:MAG: DUF1488 domain-containing protein [Janthinobacterium lividum]
MTQPSQVRFPSEPARFDGARMAVCFMAAVDDRRVECAVTAEALEDHFGASSALESELLEAFETGRGRIQNACREALLRDSDTPPLLRSGLFRVEEGEF